MKTDEYVPDAVPMMSAIANWRSVSPPNANRPRIGSSVQKDVARERVSTSLIDRLTICEYAARGMRGTFSRIRSNTMIVS